MTDPVSDPAFVETCQRWLMFHYHCKDCYQTEDRCEYGGTCAGGKTLFQHVAECNRADCTHPRCGLIKDILNHHSACKDEACRVCTPVRSYQQSRSKPPTASPGTSSDMAAPPLPLPPPPAEGAGGHSNPDEVPATPLTEMLMQVLKSEPLPVLPPLTPQLQPGESAHPLQPSPPEGADSAMEIVQQQVQQQQQQQQQLASSMERCHSLPMLPAAQAPQLQQQGSLSAASAAFAAPNGLTQAQAQQQQQQQAQGRKMGGLFEARQREHKRQATDVGQGANFGAATGLPQQQQQQQQQQQHMAALAAARASAPTSGASGAGSGGGGMPSSIPGMSHSLSASLGVTGPSELSAMYLQEMQMPGGGSVGVAPTIMAAGAPGGAGSTPTSMPLPQLQHLAQQQQQQPAGTGGNPFQRSSLPNVSYSGQAPSQQQPQQQQQQPGAQPQPQQGVLVYSNGVVAHAVPQQPLVVSSLGSAGHHIGHGPSPLGSTAAMGLHAAQHSLPGGGGAAANAAGSLAAASAAAAGPGGGMLNGSLSFGLGQPGKPGAPLAGPGAAPSGFTLAGPGAPPQGPGPQYVALPYGGYAQLASHGGVTYTIVHHPHPAHSALGPGYATVGSAPGGGPGAAPGAAQGYLMSLPPGSTLGGPGGAGQPTTWSVLQHPTAGLLHAQMPHAAGPHGLTAAGPGGAMHFSGPGLTGATLYTGGPGGAAGGAAPPGGQPVAHMHHPHQLSHLAAMPLGGGLLAAPAGAVPLPLSAQMAAGAT